MARRKARIIAVVNEKGGVGKTATVVNLGAALSLNGKEVLIVDMDPQFNATKGVGVSPDNDFPSIYDVIKVPDPVPVQSAILKTGWEHFDLLPSHVDLSGIEVELVDEPGRENRLKEALDPVLDLYDFILVDTPPSLSILTVNVLAFASDILVPCQTQPHSYSALDELLETVSIIKGDINPDIRIMGVLATFFDQRTRVSNKVLESLRADERFQDKLFDTVIRVNTTIAESAYYNKPVVFFRRSSTGAADYLALAEEILT
ncbi:MAG TPA: ParA family protein [Desulfobacterales bacterium]|nr:ParA family protein [Desulfobacterales bacterium]